MSAIRPHVPSSPGPHGAVPADRGLASTGMPLDAAMARLFALEQASAVGTVDALQPTAPAATASGPVPTPTAQGLEALLDAFTMAPIPDPQVLSGDNLRATLAGIVDVLPDAPGDDQPLLALAVAAVKEELSKQELIRAFRASVIGA